jgi:hypothetical protein
VIPQVDVDAGIQDDRWRAAVEAAFAGCETHADALYATRVLLRGFAGGVMATLFATRVEGERLIEGETPFGETPEELFHALRDRLAQGLDDERDEF